MTDSSWQDDATTPAQSAQKETFAALNRMAREVADEARRKLEAELLYAPHLRARSQVIKDLYGHPRNHRLMVDVLNSLNNEDAHRARNNQQHRKGLTDE